MILIEEKVPSKLPGTSSLFIQFNYNPEVVEIIKSFPVTNYNKDTKTWELPVTDLSEILDKLCVYDDIQLNVLKDETPIIQKYELDDFKTTPFDYQLDGIQYGLNHANFLLLDAPGLGKSLQSILIAQKRFEMGQVKHCLVICGVNSLKSNWKAEIEKHTNLSCRILGQRVNKKGKLVIDGVKQRLEQLKQPIEEFFVITNIETLRSEEIIKELVSERHNKFDMGIFDECHKAKNPQSEQSKGLIKLKMPYKIAMTGTLLISNPVDAFLPLKWVGVEHGIYSNFKYYYCNFTGPMNNILTGFKNIRVLKNQLDGCSLRRTKDILNLPEKVIINEYVDMEDSQRKFYDNIKDGIIEEVDKVELNTSCLLSLIGRLRQATATPGILTTENIPSAKMERACDLVEEICSDGKSKVVIFCSFKETANQLAELLKDYHPFINTGDIPDETIQKQKDLFQEDNVHKVFICTWQKMGTGHTLTRAETVIFIDTPYTHAEYEQAQDRCHRIGTKNTVMVYNLICKDTVDERVLEIVTDKEMLSDYIVDDKMSPNMQNRLKQIIKDL